MRLGIVSKVLFMGFNSYFYGLYRSFQSQNPTRIDNDKKIKIYKLKTQS
jgi:hypothetical protein